MQGTGLPSTRHDGARGRARAPATSCAGGGACRRRPSGRGELGASAGPRAGRRAAPAVRGPGGSARPRHGGACRRVELGHALSGRSLHALSQRRPCRCRGRLSPSDCCWKRGQGMPTGAADEGTPVAGVRGQWLPTIKTHDQDSVRALSTSLSADRGSCGPRRGGERRRRRRRGHGGAARALAPGPRRARPPALWCITMHADCINAARWQPRCRPVPLFPC
jgi:hypothetical protein